MRDAKLRRDARNGAPRRTATIQSLDRGLIILEAVGRGHGPVGLTELMQLLDIDRSSVFRLANTLRRRGFLSCPEGRKDYILGPSIWRLCRQYDWSKMLVEVCHEQLKNLATETGETAHVAVRESTHALFIDHVTVRQPIVVSGQTGEMVPLYCTAHGKALLADFNLPQLRSCLEPAPLEAHTGKTIVALNRLAEVCAEIRERGYAIDDEEYVEGMRCVAAPVRTREGVIIASIGISAPLTRFPQSRYVICGAQAKAAAHEITRLLGGAAEPAGEQSTERASARRR